jgi:hypothetical protein
MNATEVIEALKATRYAPPAWALIEQVGNATGWGYSRSADALAMSTYPSRGLELHCIEVKVDRGDWRRELARPDKAEEIASRCDRFFVAAPKGVIPVDTIPPAWGLLEVDGKKVLQTKPADKMEAKPLDRMFLAAILRRASAQSPTAQMKAEARRLAAVEAEREYDVKLVGATAAMRRDLDALLERVTEFEEASGIKLGSGSWGMPSGKRIGEAVAYLSNGGLSRAAQQLDYLERAATRALEEIGKSKAELDVVRED